MELIGAVTIPWLHWIAWLAVLFGIAPGIVAYMVWGERKAAARFQDRIGPNRVGPLGLLQPIADAIKLLTKEDLVPRSADRFLHLLAPLLLLIAAFLGLSVIPFGVAATDAVDGRGFPGLSAVDLPSSLLFLIAASGLATFGVFLAGWSGRNKFALLGSMRAVAQLVSYEIPQILATIPVILWTGGLSLAAIFNQQWEYGWFVFSPPGFIAFVMLTISGIAETNRAPFDLPEAESEIIAGYHTEYSSMRFGLFFLAEYMSILLISCLGTVLFLGGGTLPFTRFPLNSPGGSPILANALLIAVFATKVVAYIFLIFWIRVTLPRMRVDRLMGFAWKFLIPLGLANLAISAVWYECIYRNATPRPLLGWALTLPMAVASVAGLIRLFQADLAANSPILRPTRP